MLRVRGFALSDLWFRLGSQLSGVIYSLSIYVLILQLCNLFYQPKSKLQHLFLPCNTNGDLGKNKKQKTILQTMWGGFSGLSRYFVFPPLWCPIRGSVHFSSPVAKTASFSWCLNRTQVSFSGMAKAWLKL